MGFGIFFRMPRKGIANVSWYLLSASTCQAFLLGCICFQKQKKFLSILVERKGMTQNTSHWRKWNTKKKIHFLLLLFPTVCLILQNSGITFVSFVTKMLPSQLLLCILHTLGWCKRSQHSVEKTLVKILAKLIMPRYFYGIMQKNAQKRDFENLELPHLEKVCLFCISPTHKKYLQSKQWKVICNWLLY